PMQAFRAAQVLRDTITKLEGDLETAKASLAERDAAIAKLQESGRLHERQVVKELEGAHMSAAEELEALYEKRLQVEMERVKVMAASRDDIRYKGEEEVKRLKAAHAKELQELRNYYQAQMDSLETKMSEASDERAEQDRFFTEYVKQAEEDFEDHSERINKKVHVLTEAAEVREQRLKADNNILKRTNLRLKADKTIDMKRMDKLATDNAALREQTEDLRLTIDKLKRELEERDAVNADNYVTIQQLRRKVQELEKHKYVLSYKAETYSKNMEPQREEIARLQEALEGHGKELLIQANRTQVLSRHVAEKDAALRTAKTSLAEFKRRCEHQDAAITCFAQELYAAMQLPDDRSVHGKSARQKALDDLVRKYCLGDPRVSANRNAASEAIAAAAAAETRVVLLQWRLDQEARTQRATQRITLNQNSQLLRELQVAQQDNRALRDRVDEAFVALREMQHRYYMLERRAGFKSSRAGDEDLADEDDDGGGGGGISGGEEGDMEGGGSAGSGIVSMSGRVPPSRPVSSAGPTSAGPASPSGGAGKGRRTPTAVAAANGTQRHSHAQTRPGTAGGRRSPSVGFGLYRNGGPAGGGVTGVARGAPLRAFAELLVTERQRMQALAVQLESGAAAVDQQQRALLGLRDQLAAEAAVAGGDGDGDDEDPAGGDALELELGLGDGDGEDGDGLGLISSLGGYSLRVDGTNEGGRRSTANGGGGGGGGGAAGSTAATGGSSSLGEGADAGGAGREWNHGRQQQQQQQSGASRRVTIVSAGSGSGSGSGGGGGLATYHAPGIRGINTGASVGGAAQSRLVSGNTSSGRPLTASLDSSSRRSTASPSALIRARPGSSGPRVTTMRSGVRSPASAVAVAAAMASSPTPSLSAGGVVLPNSPTNRARPTSAGGVGLRAFTDDRVDRFQPPQSCTQKDLPF
ncbi:hypothetical protein Vafri_13730, partial [Volvox africanus]